MSWLRCRQHGAVLVAVMVALTVLSINLSLMLEQAALQQRVGYFAEQRVRALAAAEAGMDVVLAALWEDLDGWPEAGQSEVVDWPISAVPQPYPGEGLWWLESASTGEDGTLLLRVVAMVAGHPARQQAVARVRLIEADGQGVPEVVGRFAGGFR